MVLVQGQLQRKEGDGGGRGEKALLNQVLQGHQERWSTWEGVANRNIWWVDPWKISQGRLSFLIHSTYNTLPCPQNLHQWLGSEESCSFCSTPNASLQHILSSCKTALCQGRYRWLHDQVLRKLAEVLERQHQGSKRPPPAVNHTVLSRKTWGEGTPNHFPSTRSGTRECCVFPPRSPPLLSDQT